ncbi:MAG: extracellular solute-binding protein [Spirochaetales bacterium]|nr:extracellular solute-binding protein [Spirochaetales bacterium]
MTKTINMFVMAAHSSIQMHFNIEAFYFRRKFPDINIEFTYHPWHLGFSEIVKFIKENRGPDIVQLGNSWIGATSRLNAFYDLTDVLPEINEQTYFPVAIEMGKMPGKDNIIAAPWYLDPRLFFYRKEKLESAGIDPSSIRNWKDFETVCETLGRDNEEILECWRFIDVLILQDAVSWIWNFGGKILDMDSTEILLNKKEAIDGLRFYFSLIDRFSGSAVSEQDSSRFDRFFFRKKGVFLNGMVFPLFLFFNSALDGYNPEAAREIGIMNQPAGPVSGYAFAGGSHLAVMDYSPYKEEACKFLKFLVSYESQYRYSMITGHMPAHMGVFDDIWFHIGLDKNIILKSVFNSRPYPSHHLWNTLEPLLNMSCRRIMNAVNAKRYSDSVVPEEIEKICTKLEYLTRY